MSSESQAPVEPLPPVTHKVRMLKSIQGSENGCEVNFYRQGQIYRIGQDLFNAFMTEGTIELVDDEEFEAWKAKQEATLSAEEHAKAEEERLAAEDDANLIGSEKYGEEVALNDGSVRPIGTIVADAFASEGPKINIMSKKQWNALSQEEREAMIDAEIAKGGGVKEQKADNPPLPTPDAPLENKADQPAVENKDGDVSTAEGETSTDQPQT